MNKRLNLTRARIKLVTPFLADRSHYPMFFGYEDKVCTQFIMLDSRRASNIFAKIKTPYICNSC